MSTITPQELNEKMEKEQLFLCDVREPYEYEQWHISESNNIPLSQLAQRITSIPKEKTIITICAHGIRSERARQFLSQQGYTAFTMAGGMVAWNSVYDQAVFSTSTSEILQFRRIGKGCLSYMILSGNEALIIDPTIDTSIYLEAARERKVNIVGVLDTHTQADHISGSSKLAEAVGAPYYSADANNRFTHKALTPGQVISYGAINVQAISTPGHTPESMAFLLDNVIFTGDTLFIDSIGRPDLGEDLLGNATQLWESVHTLFRRPNSTTIFPAHYNPTVKVQKNVPLTITLGNLQSRLPLQSKELFISAITANRTPKPENFEVILAINKGLEFAEDEELRELEAGPNRCAATGN
ncbi:MBL fold metallo-hydrolase [Candidatus Woesearchaeota archaeon]|nr:MBL fold metallo-hydrolase [Candidatus Woesearchaeota archaeon]